jgi:hypothetical protein
MRNTSHESDARESDAQIHDALIKPVHQPVKLKPATPPDQLERTRLKPVPIRGRRLPRPDDY